MYCCRTVRNGSNVGSAGFGADVGGIVGPHAQTTVRNAAPAITRRCINIADIKFMQGMIGHHTQAIEMTDLLRTRSGSDVMKKLALRIELSQVDEIKMMQRWLADRGQQVPTGREHHTHGVALMPGMLTPDDMARLEAAKGVEFDRLFLGYMIRQ